MKALALAISLVFSVSSHADSQEREARIAFNQGRQTLVTGDTIAAGSLLYVLFLKEPCPLDVIDAKNMRRAWMAFGAYQVGCWYPTVDGHYVFIGQLSQLTQAHDDPLETLPRAIVHADGSATISEKNYNSDTFTKAVMNRRAMEAFQHLSEKP